MHASQFAAALAVVCLLSAEACFAAEPVEQNVTVLFNDAATPIEHALVDGEQLWLSAADVHKVNGFEPKPEGFCSAELCVPVPKSPEWRRQHRGQDYFNVTRFAEKVEQAVAIAPSKATWSFGSVPMLQSGLLPSGVAPDFALPDRNGKLVKLSDFRGKKVMLLTWASW
jgi:hypothetical protein